ncbi:MAG TPA: hypothetical protein VMZ71_01150, partial [Gemmataceae bacterium]|nr:hypothetical protein [Gemmataceae bacterium]
MRTTILFGFMLILALGCGSKKDDKPDAKTPLDDGRGAATTTLAGTGTAVPPISTPPPPKPAEWEMDTAKHATPATPVTGKLGGAAFTPEVQIQGDVLTFRVLKDVVPEREITIHLTPAQAKAVEGLKLVVKPEQPSGGEVPEITTLAPDPKPGARTPAFTLFPNAYALTLELGKKVGGKLPGKVYLSFTGDDKSFIAGTFAAEWVRPPSQPPEADETPFVHGSVGVANYPSVEVSVGYVGADKSGMLHIDMLGISLQNKGASARSDHSKPRTSTIAAGEGGTKPGRYDHTRLEPGRYLIYARAGKDGPALWEWVTVEPNTQKVV